MTAADLAAALASAIPGDEEFRRAFEVASVNKSRLARYYLRSMERLAKREPAPWYIPNDDQGSINLEHILPKNANERWTGFKGDDADLYVRRLGNQALLRASQNSDLKSADFETKKVVYAAAPYELTRQISTAPTWSPAQIDEPQKALASLAVETWPL
jgi:hypothetical protein